MIAFNELEHGDDSENKVEERTQELFDEFEQHFRNVQTLKPSIASQKDHVFQAWAVQKIAGLQLCIQQIAETYNAHIEQEQG